MAGIGRKQQVQATSPPQIKSATQMPQATLVTSSVFLYGYMKCKLKCNAGLCPGVHERGTRQICAKESSPCPRPACRHNECRDKAANGLAAHPARQAATVEWGLEKFPSWLGLLPSTAAKASKHCCTSRPREASAGNMHRTGHYNRKSRRPRGEQGVAHPTGKEQPWAGKG